MHTMTLNFPPNAPPTQYSALLQSQVEQLRALESASGEALAAYQNQALLHLFQHAYQYSAFWRERLGRAAQFATNNAAHANITPDNVRELLAALPVLSRSELQQHFADMRARPAEMAPERIMTSSTSGSTGAPVRVEKYEPMYGLLFAATSWIEACWHQRDPRQIFATTLMNAAAPGSGPSWGGAFEAMGYHGKSVTRGWMHGDAASHLDWLLAQRPAYLKCPASVAAELADLALQRGDSLPLQQILSQSERVTSKHRQLCQRAFGATIADRYSCEEIGWLAIQCPPHQSLHVTSGTVLLEILDDNNSPCPPGVSGRVVATSLHSFAMPLIRYELGDLAQWGEPCGCGNTLPVLGALNGRIRHRVHMPDGSNRTMPFLGDELGLLANISQFRIIQHPDLSLELQTTLHAPLSAADTEEIQRIFRDNGLGSLPLAISVVPRIDWPAGRKREEFVPLDPAPAGW